MKLVELNIIKRVEAIYPVVKLDFKARRKEIIKHVREELKRRVEAQKTLADFF